MRTTSSAGRFRQAGSCGAAGGALLGRGPRVSAQLPPGRHVVRLTARDAAGRLGSAAVAVRVIAVAPHVLDVRVPARLEPKARLLTFRLATTLPASLRLAGGTFAVGRTLRAITIPVRPGARPLGLRLRLTARGKTTNTTLVVLRERSKP